MFNEYDDMRALAETRAEELHELASYKELMDHYAAVERKNKILEAHMREVQQEWENEIISHSLQE
jgi:uncharacterized protein YhaN